jgi:hypothetical protein
MPNASRRRAIKYILDRFMSFDPYTAHGLVEEWPSIENKPVKTGWEAFGATLPTC